MDLREKKERILDRGDSSLCSIIPEALSFGILSELSSCDHGRQVTSGYSFLRIPVCVHGENGHRLTNVEQIVEL